MAKGKWQGNNTGQKTTSRFVPNTARETGVFKKLNLQLGYAFIRADAGGDDVYVSATELQQANLPAVGIGVRVSFRRYLNSGGKYRATDVQVGEQQTVKEQAASVGENPCRRPMPETVDADEWREGAIKWFNPKTGYGFVEFPGGLLKDAFLPKQMVEQLGLDTNSRLEKVPVTVKVGNGRKPGTIEVVSIKKS